MLGKLQNIKVAYVRRETARYLKLLICEICNCLLTSPSNAHTQKKAHTNTYACIRMLNTYACIRMLTYIQYACITWIYKTHCLKLNGIKRSMLLCVWGNLTSRQTRRFPRKDHWRIHRQKLWNKQTTWLDEGILLDLYMKERICQCTHNTWI